MSTSSNNAGQSVGDAIKGVFNTVGGAGESLRGSINSALDGAGEAITGNTKLGTNHNNAAPASSSSSSSLSSENPDSVAQRGAEQFKEGVAQLKQSGGQ